MSDFNKFKKQMQEHIALMLVGQDKLFVTDATKDEMWETYLNSFPEGTNEILNERREFDCNSCKQFIRTFGNVIVIRDGLRISIWDIPNLVAPFDVVSKAMSDLVLSKEIRNVFVTREAGQGVDKNRQILEDGKVCTWEHFYYELPKKFVDTSGKSVGDIQGTFRASKDVFKRSMEELTLEAGETVLELIDQGTLYRGAEHKKNVQAFIKYKKQFNVLEDILKDAWFWENSFNNPIVRVRNTALGTLLIDISDDMPLDDAVKRFEKIMAPANYKRPKAIFTKRMVEAAEKKIMELGFSNSLGRKHAVLSDITVNNVIFVDRDAEKKMGGSVFDSLKEDVPENVKKLNKVEEVKIEDFVENILPKASSVEVMVENRHRGNLMSLVAPINKEAPSMLKWGNNFSWAYNGDVADSMKQNVKNAGGDVGGVLRFSIQWNEDGDNNNDFDAHCIEPDGNEISYRNPRNGRTTGKLDVDITNPRNHNNNGTAVENITWTDINRMKEGRYKFFVHNYSHRGGTSGFRAEIEYDGQIYSYDYPEDFRWNIAVAEIEFSKKEGIKFLKSLDSTSSAKEVWGIKTNNFVRVSNVMFSPNYWDGQKGIGNKHYFFFIDGCKAENSPRGFYNEFLNDGLMEHKKVFEALGSKMRVADSDEQLSGLGFSSTQRNDIVVKVKGNFERVMKIIF